MASATVSNTFGSQNGPIPLAQLDTNFLDITGYVNNPYNRNNFAVDSGTTNTIALSLNPAPTGYTAGLEVAWRQTFTNTSAVSININSLGAKSVLDLSGGTLGSGQLQAGAAYKAVYNGTAFYAVTGSTATFAVATQAQMETATSSLTFVTPANLVYSPFAAKAWGMFDGSSTASITFSMTNGPGLNTVARTGTGTYIVSFTRAFSSTTYAVVGISNAGAIVVDGGRSTQTCTILLKTSATTAAVDASIISFMAFGDVA